MRLCISVSQFSITDVRWSDSWKIGITLLRGFACVRARARARAPTHVHTQAEANTYTLTRTQDQVLPPARGHTQMGGTRKVTVSETLNMVHECRNNHVMTDEYCNFSHDYHVC